jgi:ABC-2 type transport system ATP-binding protein
MIQIENLTFGYGKKKPVFQNLDLILLPGNVYGLLGRNGAGKSSLLKNIAGLLFPNEGKCIVNEQITKERNPVFLQELFFLQEEFHSPTITIKEFSKIYGAFYPNFSKKQFDGYLAEFELLETDNFKDLSFGQKKKAMISFALATNSKVLLLDEPSNGLDIPSKAQFRRVIASAITEEKIILISTHQVRDLQALIDPIIILDESEIMLNASFTEITKKLCFKTASILNDETEILYSEKSLKGYSIISENTSNEESKLDLELLFNGVLANGAKIKQIFTKTKI